MRKIIKVNNLKLSKKIDKNRTLGELLLKPTEIYVEPILELFSKKIIKTCAHITGGGITENLPRSLSKNIIANIDLDKMKVPKIFKFLKSYDISQKEMLRTFNCGYGMLLIVNKSKIDKFQNTIKKFKLTYDEIGNLDYSKDPSRKIKFNGKLNFNE